MNKRMLSCKIINRYILYNACMYNYTYVEKLKSHFIPQFYKYAPRLPLSCVLKNSFPFVTPQPMASKEQ